MAVDVVLKDRNGNELNVGKLYTHVIYIAGEGEEIGFEMIKILLPISQPFTNYNDFYNYLKNGNYNKRYFTHCFSSEYTGFGIIQLGPSGVYEATTDFDISIPIDNMEVFMDNVYN